MNLLTGIPAVLHTNLPITLRNNLRIGVKSDVNTENGFQKEMIKAWNLDLTHNTTTPTVTYSLASFRG